MWNRRSDERIETPTRMDLDSGTCIRIRTSNLDLHHTRMRHLVIVFFSSSFSPVRLDI
jgi:hypothetical protein